MIDGYKTPITIIQEEMTKQINMDMENGILKAVQRYNIDVDKEELLKALKYDREQYEKGYQAGLNANKWIPCSERLPECEWGYETKELMYQLKGTDSIEIGYYGEGGHYRDRYFRTYRDMYEGVDVSEVIAWMPLPDAYEGE